MVFRRRVHALLLLAPLSLPGCFDPDAIVPDATTGEDDSSGADSGGACVPGESQICACPDGTASSQVCNAEGSGFDPCACQGDDATVSDTSDTAGETGPDPDCEVDDDCADMASTECEEGVCNDGTCEVNPLAEGTACGDATDEECNAADTCDGAGACQDNLVAADTPCGDPTDTVCNGADTCDGAGACLDNLVAADTPCGDPTDTDCNGADTCDGAGACLDNLVAADTACGDPTEDECTQLDTCDGAGACQGNHNADGIVCSTCSLGICECGTGVCGDCSFAPINNFVTDRSIEGWTLTGDWGLYRETPQNFSNGPTVFGDQVFGTNGNRSQPYPGGEAEASSARSAPVVLPTTLDFLSWNVDEGSFAGLDTKAINVSVDGGITFTPVFSCDDNPIVPFCQFRDDTRAADDWDLISLPIPPLLVGEVGIIEFTYDTGDGCCDFEKGWYIDVTNLVSECACGDDTICESYGGECGDGTCSATGECDLTPQPAGTACGDAVTDVECNAPDACDGVGYCGENILPNGISTCSDCPAGAGECHTCESGTCVDCEALSAINDFNNTIVSINGWVIEDLSAGGTGADWRIYFSAPPNRNAGSTPLFLEFEPSFGTDGNRQAPYVQAPDVGNEEEEHSRITTTVDIVPNTLTFDSWHVDEGTTDNKIIELSVDGGMTWNELVHCQNAPVEPFCDFVGDGRLADDWDLIAIDTSTWVGMAGQLRFTYDTQDSCCSFERGWFIDNLNFAEYCTDPTF